jgi:hypothetical protein
MTPKFRPLTHYNSQNRKSLASTLRTQRYEKGPKLKAFLWDSRGKTTKKRGTPTTWSPKQITKKGQQIALRNHAKYSIHVKKDSYKV